MLSSSIPRHKRSMRSFKTKYANGTSAERTRYLKQNKISEENKEA